MDYLHQFFWLFKAVLADSRGCARVASESRGPHEETCGATGQAGPGSRRTRHTRTLMRQLNALGEAAGRVLLRKMVSHRSGSSVRCC